MVQANVPTNLHEGLVRYLTQRIKPGSFLLSILEDVLSDAVLRDASGDPWAIHNTVRFVVYYCPGTCWGSQEAVAEWLSSTDPVPMPFE